MVKLTSLALCLTLVPVSAAEPELLSEKHYRQAAWSFYQQQPATALEALQLAPQQSSRTRLLEAGLYLQLDMPARTATLLQQVLTDAEQPNALPRALRNIALLQFARYQLELGNKAQAKHYLQQVISTADAVYLGQQQLLQQLVYWPDIPLPATPDFAALAQQAEMPYIVSNQALVLAKQQPEQAVVWLQQMQQRVGTARQQGFWQLLFTGRWQNLTTAEGFIYPAEEKQALLDYLQLTEAQLHIALQDFASADAILANFASDSALSNNALSLYSYILTEQRHIPRLLAVLQQQIQRQPFSDIAWQAATRIGEQLERALANEDALAAYRWADRYYDQQQQLITEQARPLQVSQLIADASSWQQQQLSNDNQLYRLSQAIVSLQQLLQAAPERQQRLSRLAQVISYKLGQQQQLLPQRLPQFSSRLVALQQQFGLLQQQIVAAEQVPLPLLLTSGPLQRHLQQLQQAELRVQQLDKAAVPQSAQYSMRLKRLRGLLQWQYDYDKADTRWQLQQQQQTVSQQISQLQQQMAKLQQQGGQTERLLQQQQQLNGLISGQQQVNLALLTEQQQLLARLNQRLQQRRLDDMNTLQQLQRHNKESMARVMERVLAQNGNGEQRQPGRAEP
uniref:Similar to Golgin subfamily A member 2 (Cis-Golgi matrix protein GM130) n=1 Tax=Rheinheimera sp. BAL341 TaxID=1708203 RepID=A0A486XH23_9GAMM